MVDKTSRQVERLKGMTNRPTLKTWRGYTICELQKGKYTQSVKMWNWLTGSEQGSVESSCEHGNGLRVPWISCPARHISSSKKDSTSGSEVVSWCRSIYRKWLFVTRELRVTDVPFSIGNADAIWQPAMNLNNVGNYVCQEASLHTHGCINLCDTFATMNAKIYRTLRR
jgi:hypothetical protein